MMCASKNKYSGKGKEKNKLQNYVYVVNQTLESVSNLFTE